MSAARLFVPAKLAHAAPIPIDATRKAFADRVVKAVCAVFDCGVTPADIKSRLRDAPIADARHVCFYVLWHAFGWRCTWTARAFAMDHSSVLHGRAKVQARVLADPEFAEQIGRAIDLLKKKGGG
jgi:chromosomal replication initiation ATPase DnaA